ncbi:pyridoxamine 5'-phosphate oxidase family protein [Demequina mangrovi]|uniref:Pyridoxamine 5'-phosphate oxidase N-terminal domain-containing protein n=1 Tax=Demequina mangrovi TaxID=1043493 RepID=A0A1H7B3C0_9MICO|nr:pyridoxamine 5'-phosphate oxidase family protein [Demequina mangrovi]SEJ71414.1 hypothetical protein SAMN05421637_2784 [Demequina mangrovi]
MADEARAGRLYGDGARGLQDRFDTRRLADAIAGGAVREGLDEGDAALIAQQSKVWIATTDADGWPDVSYKGGDPGFVRVTGPSTLELPSYDGNGMWRTLGNIEDDGRVALLFIDEGRPWRLRVHGTAVVVTDPARVEAHHGAQAVVEVTVGRVFPNCGRYVHRSGERARFVPRPGERTAIPDWKRLDGITETLPRRDLDALAADDGTLDGWDGSGA